MLGALPFLLRARANRPAGRRSPSRPLPCVQMSRPDDLLTRAREALPEAAYRTGDFDAVEALLTEAMRLAEAEGDRASQAAALDQLGELRHFRTLERPRDEWPSIDHGLERDQFERALAIRRGLGDRAGMAESLLHLGWVHQVLLGDGAKAMPLFREALDVADPDGDAQVRSELHRHIGFHIAIDEGRPEAALPHFRTSLDLWRSGSEPARVIHGLVALARCESSAGLHEAALAHSQEALDLVRAGSYRPRVVNGAAEARRVVEAALPRP
jgi:tetratricopeptide (TPR) repeat protein